MFAIDCHDHVYNKRIAPRAVQSVGEFYDVKMNCSGIADELIKISVNSPVKKFVINAVALSPKPVCKLNDFIAGECGKHSEFTGLGTLHPDMDGMEEELGDILMQVVFHARMAEEKGMFTLQDVIDGVTDKLIERHPHVFGTVKVANSDEVLTNWEAIKLQEKPERERVLDGIYKGLPSLLRAHKIQKRVAKVGFDWTETEDVKKKVLEEWKEFNEAAALQDQVEMEKELGDLYFSLVNFARHFGLESETALNRCNNRFVTRFEHVEDRVTESEKGWSEYSLEELDRFWDEAKEAEE